MSAPGPDGSAVLSLDHVQLAAPPGCEPAARRFYGELLGLAELAKPEPLQARGGVWFALGAGQLHIGIADPFRPAGKAHPALRLADETALETLAQRLADAGAPVRWDAELPAVRRFYTEDPWGNRLELLAAHRAAPKPLQQSDSLGPSQSGPVAPPRATGPPRPD